MRRYIPDYSDEGISRDRYLELLHFCRQYRDWKMQADSFLGAGAQKYNPMPHGEGAVSDPTQTAMLKREQYRAKIDLVDQAIAAAGAEWKTALIMNVCYGRPYYQISPVVMPTSKRTAYYEAKRLFFIALDRLKGAD